MIHSGYTKLFSSIVASTIWREDDKTRLVWITLLALSDRDGYVAASLPGLADLAHVSLKDCEMAIAKLQQPDQYSRSPEHDGRRIEPVVGGWLILNRAKYRDLVPEEHRREQNRLRQQRHRRKQEQSDVMVSRVTEHDSHEMSRKTETEEEEEEKERNRNPSGSGASVGDDAEAGYPRHAQIRQLIQDLHHQTFRVICQWDGSERKALDRLLSANPSWTVEELTRMVRNRFRSEAITSDRPRKWLPNLGSYAAGPQDRFNKLKGSDHDGNGNGNRAERRQAGNIAAAKEAVAILQSRMAH
jgi:hypothetical protein